MQEHLGKISTRHDEFRDQIHVVIAVGAEVGGSFAGLELFKQIGQVERGAISSVVAIAVQLQDALALDRQEARNDAFLEARSENDGVVLSVGESFHALGQPVKSGLFCMYIIIRPDRIINGDKWRMSINSDTCKERTKVVVGGRIIESNHIGHCELLLRHFT